VQHAGFVHVVELEALYLGAVYQRGMRRRQFLARAPHGAFLGGVETAQRALQNAAPLEIGGVQAATECIEHQELDALPDFLRDRFVFEPGDKAGDAARMRIFVDDCDMRTMEKLKGRRKDARLAPSLADERRQLADDAAAECEHAKSRK